MLFEYANDRTTNLNDYIYGDYLGFFNRHTNGLRKYLFKRAYTLYFYGRNDLLLFYKTQIESTRRSHNR
jgi:hypothetical protein